MTHCLGNCGHLGGKYKVSLNRKTRSIPGVFHLRYIEHPRKDGSGAFESLSGLEFKTNSATCTGEYNKFYSELFG